MPLWRLIKQQYESILRAAGTKLAERMMYGFSALESIIIPIPVDPLLVATVLARPAEWRLLTFGCTMASVVGGMAGWGIGVLFGLNIADLLAILPAQISAEAAFAAVESGFQKFGIFLVFLGAFSPLPYKVIAISAGLGGFGLIPFLVTSIIGRGLRFAIVAALARHHSNPKYVILLITALICLFAGALWLTR
jgi:membrane protein YqaA with SNARE-associated domain